MSAIITAPYRSYTVVVTKPPPVNDHGQLYDEATGAILYDEVTGSPITA